MKNCILFCRVSTSKQDWERQEQSLRDNAHKDGYTDDHIIVIGHKESGYKLEDDERKGLQELTTRIEHGDVDCIYLWELSRLARKPSVLYKFRDVLKEKQVQLICDKPSFKLLTSDLKEFDTNGQLVFAIFAALAEQEIFLKKARFADGKKKNASLSRYNGGNIPYGYKLNADKTFSINEEQATIIREIYNLYEDGMSMPNLVRELRAKYTNTKITMSFIHNILSNELLTGREHETEEKSVEVHGHTYKWNSYARSYPPIISGEQYDRCRSIATKNKTNSSKAKNIYFADRIFKCPECGRYMIGVGSRVVYQCYDAHSGNRDLNGYDESTRCQYKKTFSINMVDTVLWHAASYLEVQRIARDVESEKLKHLQTIENLEDKYKNIEERIKIVLSKVERLNELYIDGNISQEQYNERKAKLEQEINEIKKEGNSYQDEIRRINTLINSLDVDDTIKDLLIKQDFYIYHTSNEDVELKLQRGSSNQRQYTPTNQKQTMIVPNPLASKEWHEIELKIYKTLNDAKRQEIVKRNIKDIAIKEINVQFTFGIGKKDIIGRHYTILSYDDTQFYFLSISNSGKGGKIFYSNETGDIVEKDVQIPIISRFHNDDKKNRRERQRLLKQETLQQQKEGMLSLKELSLQTGRTVKQLRYAIAHKGLQAEKIGKEWFIRLEVWNTYKDNNL